MAKKKDKWMAMQENLGNGNKGRIIITTPEKVQQNLPWIAEVDTVENAKAIKEVPNMIKALKKLIRLNNAGERYCLITRVLKKAGVSL